MSWPVKLLVAAFLIFVGLAVIQSLGPNPGNAAAEIARTFPNTNPQYEWRSEPETELAMEPTEYRFWSLTRGAKFRIAVRASQPITFVGISRENIPFGCEEPLNAAKCREALRNWKGLVVCQGNGVLKHTFSCDLETGGLLVLLDQRSGTESLVGGALAAWTRDSNMLARATEANRVSVTFSQYACVANCR